MKYWKYTIALLAVVAVAGCAESEVSTRPVNNSDENNTSNNTASDNNTPDNNTTPPGLCGTQTCVPGESCIEESCVADSDGDMVPDGEDNCPGVANPDQADTDGDGSGRRQQHGTAAHLNAVAACSAIC